MSIIVLILGGILVACEVGLFAVVAFVILVFKLVAKIPGWIVRFFRWLTTNDSHTRHS